MREALIIFMILITCTIYLSATTFAAYLKLHWDEKQCDYLYLANMIHGNKHSYNKSLKICLTQYRQKKGYDGYYTNLNNRMKYLVDYLRKQTDRYNNIFYTKLNTQIDSSMNSVSSQLDDPSNVQNIYIHQQDAYNTRLKKKADLLNNVYLNTYKYKVDEVNIDKYKTKEYITYITNA